MKEHMKEQLLKEKPADKESSLMTIPTKQANKTPTVVETESNGKQTKPTVDEDFLKYVDSNNINVLKCNNQVKELHTVLRDKETTHSDFKFYSDRLVTNLSNFTFTSESSA